MDAGAYLIDYLQELDFCERGDMGPKLLSFREIESWQHSTGLHLDSWEVLTLRQLSREYIDQLHRSRDRMEPAPYRTDDLPRQREAVHSFFKNLARNHNGRPNRAKRKGKV